MHADMAANSDSTLKNWQEPIPPLRTRAANPSTMWVWGEMGEAAMTSGWHSATVSATAFEPSSCLGMDCLRGQTAMSGPGGGRVALGHPPGEPLGDRAFDGVDGYGTGGGGHSAEKGGVGQGPAE